MHRERLAPQLQDTENGSRLFIEQEMEALFFFWKLFLNELPFIAHKKPVFL